MRRAGRGYLMLVGVLVIGAVVATWVLVRGSASDLEELTPQDRAVLVPVQETTVDFSAPATLSAQVAPGRSIPAPALTGTVTGVEVAPGDVLSGEEKLYAVDGVPVVAYADEGVLFRPLSRGDRGPDVATAQRFLNSLLDADLDDDGVFGATTRSAVQDYERRIGIQDPTGVLDPGWFAHLPTESFEVAEVDVQAGAPAPAAGQPVATGTASLADVTMTSASAGPAGAYELLVRGEAVPVERAEDGSWQVTDLDAAASVVLADAGAVDQVSVTGQVRLLDGQAGQAVPAAAIITDSTDSTCVAATTSSTIDGASDLAVVEVLGSSVDGLAQLRPTLPEGARVLVNPVPVLGDVTCPSS